MSKNGKGGPGRALVKHHNHLVTEAKKQGYGRTKRVLESVTDVKDVEVVIEEAEEAGRLFSAQNPAPNLLISLDLNSSNNGLTPSERKEQQKTEEALYKDSIQIPRRPPWHAEMPAEEFDARERQSFLNWRRKLARVEENQKLVLTPFEKNIEIWRQLWRVLERSDLVVTVVDARNPLFYRCCDLEYVLPVSLPNDFDNNVKQVIYGLSKYMRWLSLKEIHQDEIKYWKREIPQLMCEKQKYLRPKFFNAQEHYLIHQVEEIEMCRPVHTRSLWMVERHLKSLKALVRQRARPKGSMVEGNVVYESMVYISYHLPILAAPVMDVVDCIWDVNSIKK